MDATEELATEGIDRNSFVPFYHQLKVILGDRIRRGHFRPDDPLPSEHELSKSYGVSRATVRKALAELASEGLVYTVKGKGSFVAKPKLEQSLFRFYSLGRDLRSQGQQLGSRILKQRRTTLGEENASRLRRMVGEPAVEITRIRLLDGVPLAIEHSLVVGDGIYTLLEADLKEASIYDVMEQATGRVVVKAEEFLEPVILDEYEAMLLKCDRGRPAFHIERLSYLEEERPFERRTSLIRGDRFRFYTELR